ncbi:hypothetical protein BDV93DRAFT_548106 [Ceratobasidium sp. AG-I]|nr:hypothetical protein BDV93DRAFT_548106 [Ceratobasidium sp. AG-I]
MYLPKLNELSVTLPKITTLARADTSHLSPSTLESYCAVWQSHSFKLRTPHRRLCQYRRSNLDTLARILSMTWPFMNVYVASTRLHTITYLNLKERVDVYSQEVLQSGGLL